jgi:hypothetical protein
MTTQVTGLPISSIRFSIRFGRIHPRYWAFKGRQGTLRLTTDQEVRGSSPLARTDANPATSRVCVFWGRTADLSGLIP